MNNFTISKASAAVDLVYLKALGQTTPVQATPQTAIADNCTIGVDIYSGPNGSGFVVTAIVDLKFRKVFISKQSAPARLDVPAPALSELLDECRAAREVAYPLAADYLDAKVKQSSSDSAIVAIGIAQEAAYLAACLAVKDQFPKPQ